MKQEDLYKLFYVDEDGDFRWKISRSNRVRVGEKAGSINTIGYRIISLSGKDWLAHRLVWLYYNGYLPENDIDHINRKRSDNRINNLRVVSKTCNAFNKVSIITSSSGIRGVYFHKTAGKWMASISINNRQIYLGLYDDIVEAVAHRAAAEEFSGIETCIETESYKFMKNFVERNNNKKAEKNI